MPNNILITPGSASIQFSGSAASTIRLQVENSGSIAFYGNSGSLFGITDSLSGSLMSVNDISGLPILEVFSDDRIVMGTFNKNTLVVTGSRVGIDKAVPTADLDISGSVFITGSLRMSSGGITGSLFGTSSLATTSSYVLSTGLPTGTVSSSVQINTGSFSGSFTGTLIGTSSWASNAISSSFATTASAADSITFIPPTASFATSASFAVSASYAPSAPGGGITSLTAGDGLTGGTITSTGTITLDTGSAHFLDGVKKELNTEGVISSSIQINTGSFSGSFTGELIGTSSYAMSASYVLTAVSSSFATTASAADSITFIPPTASFATNAVSASYFTGSVTFPSGLIVTGSILATTVSASLFLGPLAGTASFATSASFAPDTTFPYTGSAIISGSLRVTGSTVNSGSVLVTAGDLTLTNPTQTTLNYTQAANAAFIRLSSTDFRLGSVSNQTVSFMQNSGVAWYIDTTKHLLPNTNNVYDIGLTGQRVRTIWTTTISSSNPIASASYALSASYAPSAPGGGITSLVAGDGLTGGTITSTGTITLDTGSVHFLDGVKKELNTEGVISSSAQVSYTGLSNVPSGIVSSSSQINTGSFTGSFTGIFTGSLFGTSSVANAVESITELQVNEAIAGGQINTNAITVDADITAGGTVIGTIVSASNIFSSGSIIHTGSLNILSGSINVTRGGVTSSLFGTASFATSASYVLPSGLPLGTISSSLQFNTVTAPFTGSFTGSFSGSIDRFNPVALRISVGTTAPASPAVNDLWVDTN